MMIVEQRQIFCLVNGPSALSGVLILPPRTLFEEVLLFEGGVALEAGGDFEVELIFEVGVLDVIGVVDGARLLDRSRLVAGAGVIDGVSDDSKPSTIAGVVADGWKIPKPRVKSVIKVQRHYNHKNAYKLYTWSVYTYP